MDKLFMCALRFRRSGRMQDVRSCWQQVCNFINRRGEGAVAQKNQGDCVAFCHWGSFKKSRTMLFFFLPFEAQQQESTVWNISRHIFLRYPAFPTNDLTSLRAVSSCLPMRVFFFPPPWKVDIMNPHQWRDSFFTLLATEPPVRTAVDVTPIIDLVRHSQSSRSSLFFFFFFFWCSRLSVRLRYLAAAMPAGLRNHLLRWSQHVIDYLRSSCLAPLFVFRSFFFVCFLNHYRLFSFFSTLTHTPAPPHTHTRHHFPDANTHTQRDIASGFSLCFKMHVLWIQPPPKHRW